MHRLRPRPKFFKAGILWPPQLTGKAGNKLKPEGLAVQPNNRIRRLRKQMPRLLNGSRRTGFDSPCFRQRRGFLRFFRRTGKQERNKRGRNYQSCKNDAA